jgi:Tfp pilus assembly protein PilO
MSVTRKWSLLAVVLILAILAAGWFLLVAPKRSDAADLRDQSTAQDQANARLVSDLEMLKQQQLELPKKQAELAVMRKQIPDNPALPTLIRSLTEAGRKVGVSLDTMAPAVPVPVVAAQPAAVAPVTTESTESTGSTESTESTGSTGSTESTESTEGSTGTESAGGTAAGPPVAAAPTPTLYQVPLTVDVTGSYFELEQFINKLEGLKRSFLVSGFTLVPAATSTTGEQSPADGPAPGDLTLTLQGRVFLSPPAVTTAATTPTPAASTAATGQ